MILLLSGGLCLAIQQAGADVRLAWDASPEPEVSGYRVYYGTASGTYLQQLDAGKTTGATVPGVSGTYYFVVTAYTADGTESSPSNEVVSGATGNQAPTLSAVSNSTVNEDTPSGALAFTVGDAETAAAGLTVSGSSSNTALVPNSNIVFGGSGASRTVKLTPAANQSGATTITLTVSDGALSASRAFTLTVTAANDAPTITDIGNQSTPSGTPVSTIPFTVGDLETAAANLTVSGVSSNTALVPNPNIVFGGSGTSRTVKLTPAAGRTGTATITVAVSDGSRTASDSFVLTVTAATPSGLVAAYGFNEGTGAVAADSSGNEITGAIKGAAWTTGGKYGGALSFNGSSSYVDLGNAPALQLTGSMTWSAWVKAAANPADDGQIISKSDASSGWQGKSSPDTGPHTFGVAVSGSGGSRAQRYSAAARSLNVWYHVAGVYDAAAKKLDIYVNGALNNGVLRGTIPAVQVNAAVNMNIGRRTGGYYFNGLIDEVRLYNRALSSAEIQSDMNTPVGTAGMAALKDAVTLVESTPPPLSDMLTGALDANGSMVLSIKGTPGEVYSVEASTDLSVWETIGTLSAGDDGTGTFTDPHAPGFQSRYYRLRINRSE